MGHVSGLLGIISSNRDFIFVVWVAYWHHHHVQIWIWWDDEQYAIQKDLQKLPQDPSSSLEQKMKELPLSLKCSVFINNTLCHWLCSSAIVLNGLLKMHKPKVLLWPSNSFFSSHTYQPSKHLVYNLSPLFSNTSFCVKNSNAFATFIFDQTTPDDKIFVFFNATSLFTSSPRMECCSI